MRAYILLIIWTAGSGAICVYLFAALRTDGDRTFMPGKTTHGHYQIELSCSACHNQGDGGGGVRQNACLECHQTELALVGDSHPVAKFEKPLDATRLLPIDHRAGVDFIQGRYCITCHVEHAPERTGTMGLTQPTNYCKACHADIGENRETHRGLKFTTCLTAGCHNYHDNSALFEQFLIDHRDDPKHWLAKDATVPKRDFGKRYRLDHPSAVALKSTEQNAPPHVTIDAQSLHDWETTAHARAGVNCMDCHQQPESLSTDTAITQWVEKPSFTSCQKCHDNETHGFLGSRHGMRLSQGLSPMTPSDARLPMKADAAAKQMSCNACHTAHRFDTRIAAFDACIQCHDDQHSRAYQNSPHHDLWQNEVAGITPAGSGVSCATCHMPRVSVKDEGKTRVEVKHNQNDTLRPNEKMIRAACLNCHGLPFTIDALADRQLINGNFQHAPKQPHFSPSSFDMITQKLLQRNKQKKHQPDS